MIKVILFRIDPAFLTALDAFETTLPSQLREVAALAAAAAGTRAAPGACQRQRGGSILKSIVRARARGADCDS